MRPEGKDTWNNRDRIGVVLYLVYLAMLVLSVVIFAKIVCIQVSFSPDPKIVKALTPDVEKHTVYPERGNIMDCNGRLLAMSCPVYQIYFDCTAQKDDIEGRKELKLKNAKSEEQRKAAMDEAKKREYEWLSKAEQMCVRLSEVFPEKSAAEYMGIIRNGRAHGKKYVRIGHPVDMNVYREMLTFPLINEGRFKSGFIAERSYVRKYPYGNLARRTIGYVRDNTSLEKTHIGLEGKFDHVLHGVEGKEYLRITDNGKMRDNDSSFVKSENGLDLRTTINIDYQEIADKALREQVEGNDELEGACLVLMETASGAIRAMVNLVRNTKTGEYEETMNYAIGRKIEPGSVFKTVTLMSVLNDGYLKSLEKTYPATDGIVKGTSIKDRHIPEFRKKHHTDRISVIDGFKISSNYVFATLAVENYGKKPMHFIENIYSYKLGEAFDFDLEGLLTPTIPNPEKMYWTNTDLGSLGFGYSSEETPLHILTFYNAIANKGKMMKPYLVEDIEENGVVISKRGCKVLNSAICSAAVADTLSRALKAVTSDGTAKSSLEGVKCEVAGKTGTSYGVFRGGGYSDSEGRQKYQGTFVGYFPAEDPRYSIISVVYSLPTKNSYQGGGIPAKAVRTVIDRIYDIDPCFRTRIKKAR